jgi:hypothetical protein
MSQDGPPAPPPSYPPPTGRPYVYPQQPVVHTGTGWYVVAGLLRAALVITAFTDLATLIGSWWAAGRLGAWLDDPRTANITDAQRIDTINQVSAFLELFLLLVTGVLFICWLYQAYGRPLAERSALRMSRGWAIGGWFIPIASWVIPYRVVQGVNAATSRPPRADSRLVIAWWASWVISNVCDLAFVAATPDTSLDHGRRLIRDLKTIDTWSAVTAVPDLVATILALLVVVRITARVRAVNSVAPIPSA